MKHIELKGQIREAGNKAAVKAVRRAGQVPCNIYGLLPAEACPDAAKSRHRH